MLETLTIIKDYGWSGLLVAFLIFLLYKFASGWVSTLVDHIKGRLSYGRQDKLSTHAFFNSMNYILNVEIQSLNIFPDKPVRQALTRDLIFCSLSAMHEVAEKMIKLDHSNWSKSEWTFQMRNLLNEMNSLFLNKSVSNGIPELVYMKYLEWYFGRLNHMRILVDQIASSQLSPTPESKTSTLLLLFNLFITTMMGDCESAMGELNGEITGLIYRGGIIEAHGQHHHHKP